jgi:integrase
MDLTNRLNTWAGPSPDRSASIRPLEEVHAASARELDRLAAGPLLSCPDRIAFRDALLMMFLSVAPVRRRNLTSIEIGRHLIEAGNQTTLYFPESETKNHQRLIFDLPSHVTAWLAVYLDRVRPGFHPGTGCKRLWIGITGKPLSAKNTRERVILVTKHLLGTPITPHRFRACAATTLALRSQEMALLAAPILGHKQFGTTEKYYIHARQLDASRRINDALAAIRHHH